MVNRKIPPMVGKCRHQKCLSRDFENVTSHKISFSSSLPSPQTSQTVQSRQRQPRVITTSFICEYALPFYNQLSGSQNISIKKKLKSSCTHCTPYNLIMKIDAICVISVGASGAGNHALLLPHTHTSTDEAEVGVRQEHVRLWANHRRPHVLLTPARKNMLTHTHLFAYLALTREGEIKSAI